MTKNDINEGDDVIIAGKIVPNKFDILDQSKCGKIYLVELPSGHRIVVKEEDIKSYRPEVKVDGEDHRKGN